MALLHPHPGLKVAAPESPMVDGWMATTGFTTARSGNQISTMCWGKPPIGGKGVRSPREGRDDYTNFLQAGSADAFAKAEGMEQLPFWRVMVEHPAYDGYWQSQALDKLIVQQPLTVPTMWEQGLWTRRICGAPSTAIGP